MLVTNYLLRTYKYNKKIVAYIRVATKKGKKVYTAYVGKPSDRECLGFQYNTFEEAEKATLDYMRCYGMLTEI